MNKQGQHGIEWTHVFGPGTGYTWNVISGCEHDCRWTMPDGTVAGCYAKEVAEGIAKSAYPHGFEHIQFHPERLREPFKHTQPAGIFLDSMSDLMGHNVPREAINEVLEVCRLTPQHIYFLLTKNAPRLETFSFPSNVWVGVSSPPDYMFGKPLDMNQKRHMLTRSLAALDNTNATIKWMSIEPLSWDLSTLLMGEYLDWAVIGAASRGKTYYQPDPQVVQNVLDVLDMQHTPVFFKGNLRGNAAAMPWREMYPLFEGVE